MCPTLNELVSADEPWVDGEECKSREIMDALLGMGWPQTHWQKKNHFLDPRLLVKYAQFY